MHLLRNFAGDDYIDHVAIVDRTGDGLATGPAIARREHGIIRRDAPNDEKRFDFVDGFFHGAISGFGDDAIG